MIAAAKRGQQADVDSDETRLLRAARESSQSGMYTRNLIDMVRLYLESRTNSDIAARLGVSRNTVAKLARVADSIGIVRICGCGRPFHLGLCSAKTSSFMGRRIEYRVKHPPEPSMCGCGRPLHRGMCSAKLAKFMPQRRQKRAEAWRAGTKDRVAARIAKPPYLIAIERATADIWDLAVRDEVRQELALAFLSTGLEEEHFKGQAEILRRRISHTRFQTVSLHDVVPGSDSVTLMDKLSNESQAMAYDGIEWHRGRHGWQPDD